MAYRKKSWQDAMFASFGQESETTPQGNKDGLAVGGVYNTTPPTIGDGEFSRLQVDANGFLMTNIVTGEVVASLGTVNKLLAGSIVVTAGTISDLDTVGTIGVINAGSVVVTAGTVFGSIIVTDGTIDTCGTIGVLNAGSVIVTAGTVINTPINSVAVHKGTVTIVTDDTNKAGTLTSTVAGLIRNITQVTPDMEGTGTATTMLVDSVGGTIATLAAQVEGLITNYGTIVPLSTDMSWITTADGTQSVARDVILNIHYEQ